MLCTHPTLLTRRLNPTPTVHCPPSLLCVRSAGAHFFRRSRKFSFIKRKSFRNRIQIALSQNRFANTQSHQYTSLFSSDASPYKKIEMEQTIVLLDFVFAPTSLQRRDSFLFCTVSDVCHFPVKPSLTPPGGSTAHQHKTACPFFEPHTGETHALCLACAINPNIRHGR